MREPTDIIIIGGSAAGINAAQAIVETERRGSLVMISAEQRLPYKRTKVCKSFAKSFEPDAFAVLDRDWYEPSGVELLLGTTVTSLDLAGRTVTLDDGQRRRFDQLILATGARPRCLPVSPELREAVCFAHDITQVEALRERAVRGERALVIGMGVLGVEVAEQLTRMGKQVTLAGDTSRLMAQHLNEVAAARLAELMTSQGVTLLFDEMVKDLTRRGDEVEVSLTAGRRTFDLVVCCIGLELRTELARLAGLQLNRGVLVDERLRTSHPAVLAAGDVAEHPGGLITHLWRHAMHQGRVAGLNATGAAEPYALIPFRVKCTIFDHYFFALQRPDPADLDQYDVVERRDGERYVCCYYQQDELKGLVMIDDSPRQKEYNQAVAEGWQRPRVEGHFGLR